MAVFLGAGGQIELQRSSSTEKILGTVAISDVNTTRDRFSFNFNIDDLITGDQVEIRATDNGLLDFVAATGWPDNTVYSDGIFYVHVDDVGGIRLYNAFEKALAGEVDGRINLVTPTRAIPISVEIRNTSFRILGQVTNFEINTERTAVDVTALSEDFRQQYSSVVSGSGRIECLFDYDRKNYLDATQKNAGASEIEVPIYMNQLILRTKAGSKFNANLILIKRGPKPFGKVSDNNDEIYYKISGLVTNVGMAFEPAEPVRATIEYVTTGPIQLKVRTVTNYLLQEDGDRLRLEANQSGFIELEQQD